MPVKKKKAGSGGAKKAEADATQLKLKAFLQSPTARPALQASSTSLVQCVGTKRKADVDLAQPKLKSFLQGTKARPTPSRSVTQSAAVDRIAYTELFKDQVDTKLSQLDNGLIIWEVSRSIYPWPLEAQVKALESEIPEEPRNMDLGALVGCTVEEDYDIRITGLIQQIRYQMQFEAAPRATPIENLLQAGRIRCAIGVVVDEDNHRMVLRPRQARVQTSNQLLRTYGSDCWIQVQLSELTLHQIQRRANQKGVGGEVWRFLNRPLRLAGRFYRTAIVKDDSVWFFSSPSNCPKPIGIMELIERELPVDLNRRMKLSKYKARLQLALSTTTSSITFKPQDIRRVPDVHSNSLRISQRLMEEIATEMKLGYTPSAIKGAHKVAKSGYVGQHYSWVLFDPVGLPSDIWIEVWNSDQISISTEPNLSMEFVVTVYEASMRQWTEKTCELTIPRAHITLKVADGKRKDGAVMTDGAAAVSWAAALKIKESLALTYLPAAYQARILKTKGLWYLGSSYDRKSTWIEIRDSQWKGDVMCEPDESLTFNVCNFSVKAKPGHVNRQSMPVLASRQVPVSTFVNLQKEMFRSILDALTSTDPVRLACTLESYGQLLPMKAERIATTVNGYHSAKVEEQCFGFERYSRRPLHPIEETVELLKSGFSPRHYRVIHLLDVAGKYVLDQMINFKLTVPLSASVYAMPDPTGTLKEGEVFLQLSNFKDPETSLLIPILKGDCIVSRSPCVHPMDARKVNAVANQHLMKYDDVLICSVLGDRSLLDYLSGGDYDGDTVTVIWDGNFVENFVNADHVRDSVPFEVYDKYFSDMTNSHTSSAKNIPISKVQDLCDLKERNGTYEEDIRKLQLSPLFQTVDFGRYSQMYKVCEYLSGVDDELTKKLGYVYVKCLDAAKQGLILKPQSDAKLKQEFEQLLSSTLGTTVKDRGNIPLPPWTKQIDIAKDPSKEWGLIDNNHTNKTYLPLRPTHVLEAIAIAAKLERIHFRNTLKMLEVGVDDSALTGLWLSFASAAKHDGACGHILWRFINRNVRNCYREYLKARENKSHIPAHQKFESAWKTFWVDGHFSNVLEVVKDDPYLYHFLQGRTEVGYNLLRASAASAIAAEKDHFAFHMAFHELCHLMSNAEEQKHMLNSGVQMLDHLPRAFAPEFNQAMMLKKSLILPDQK